MNDAAGPVPSEDGESFVCALCGHEMTFDRCGFAGVNEGDETLHLCHADDHDCYERFTVNGERPAAGPVCNRMYSGELWVPRRCVQPLGHSGFHADCFGQTWTAAGPVPSESVEQWMPGDPVYPRPQEPPSRQCSVCDVTWQADVDYCPRCNRHV